MKDQKSEQSTKKGTLILESEFQGRWQAADAKGTVQSPQPPEPF